jgi:dTDP-4-dehydrorhamnose reductase
MRTVVLGSAGQLGRDLVPRLSGEVLAWTRADVDLIDFEGMRKKLQMVKPDVVINCAAYNLVDKAESESDVAFSNNVWAVKNLAESCQAINAKLVQFSTDYVFGLEQTRTTPFTETDAPGPVSMYGVSKLSGEYLVRSHCERHLVLRVCGLYGLWGSGGKGGNFVETMLRVANAGKPLRVVNDQRCTPSYCVDVADTTVNLLANDANGLFHITNADSCTWYEFAQEIFRLSSLQPDLTPITSREFGALAKRPAYSVLANEKLRSVGVAPPRPWREALAVYLQERGNKQTALVTR